MLCFLTKFHKKKGCHRCQPNIFEVVFSACRKCPRKCDCIIKRRKSLLWNRTHLWLIWTKFIVCIHAQCMLCYVDRETNIYIYIYPQQVCNFWVYHFTIFRSMYYTHLIVWEIQYNQGKVFFFLRVLRTPLPILILLMTIRHNMKIYFDWELAKIITIV